MMGDRPLEEDRKPLGESVPHPGLPITAGKGSG